jgi:P27 family predicted phage terminase small subunit
MTMGRRGPPPTPTAILKLRGSWRGKKREGEPTPQPFDAQCPEWLGPLAKEVWAIVTEQLVALGVIGKTDAGVLERYCATYEKWREAEAYVKEHGPIQRTAQGDTAHPYAMMAIKLGEQLTKLESLLGLSPAARANLAKPKETKEEKDRFFDGGEKTA